MDNEDTDRTTIDNEVLIKSAKVATLQVTDAELKEINKLTLEPLTAEEIFIYKVAMCDNEIDRDFEVFPVKSLKKLKTLFQGRTMIKDHERRADNQVARIYATEVVASETEKSKTGEAYSQLVAHCYMLNNEQNKTLISEIKAGIKKEVSVGLRTEKAVCSICGTDNKKAACPHWWGMVYDGKQCHFSLDDPYDAYELSFVAVPAQPRAGVMKSYGPVKKELPEPNQATPPEPPVTEPDYTLKLKALDAFLFTQNNSKSKGENE